MNMSTVGSPSRLVAAWASLRSHISMRPATPGSATSDPGNLFPATYAGGDSPLEFVDLGSAHELVKHRHGD
jgi:hypothetical protein